MYQTYLSLIPNHKLVKAFLDVLNIFRVSFRLRMIHLIQEHVVLVCIDRHLHLESTEMRILLSIFVKVKDHLNMTRKFLLLCSNIRINIRLFISLIRCISSILKFMIWFNQIFFNSLLCFSFDLPLHLRVHTLLLMSNSSSLLLLQSYLVILHFLLLELRGLTTRLALLICTRYFNVLFSLIDIFVLLVRIEVVQ